jgi:hypothetical protein
MIYRRIKHATRSALLATAARISKRKAEYSLERKMYRIIGTGKYGLPESELIYAASKNEAAALGKKKFEKVFLVEQLGGGVHGQ